MAYRGDDAGDALEAQTADGLLKVVLGPNRADLTLGVRGLHIAGRVATLVEHKRQKQERRASVKIDGILVVARGVPRDDVGIWVEHAGEDPGMHRIFGVSPKNPLEKDGLPAIAKLDAVAGRLRAHLGELAGSVVRALEIGAGHPLDKVLLADHGD